jgi:hypothetical protein
MAKSCAIDIRLFLNIGGILSLYMTSISVQIFLYTVRGKLPAFYHFISKP